MNTKLIYLLLLFPILSFGQVRGDMNDQNPNYKQSETAYAEKANEAYLQQGVTLQNTYKAIDEWQEKKDLKKYKKRARFETKMYRRKYGVRNYYNPYPYTYQPQRNYNYHRRNYNNYPYLFLIP